MGANTCKLCLERDDVIIVIVEISLDSEGTRDNRLSCILPDIVYAFISTSPAFYMKGNMPTHSPAETLVCISTSFLSYKCSLCDPFLLMDI